MPGQGRRPLTWALSTCPLTMSRKTLGTPAAIVKGTRGKPPRLRAHLLVGALVALETDGVARGTSFLEAGNLRKRVPVGGGAQAQPVALPRYGNAGTAREALGAGLGRGGGEGRCGPMLWSLAGLW